MEIVLEQVYFDRELWLTKKPQPFYGWSYNTSNGERIGPITGPLKLMVHPKVGYTNLPNQDEHQFSINSHGFRGPEPLADTIEKIRIILVGGSTAFSTGAKSDKETFAQQLEEQLNDSFPTVEVINAAVIGHRSGQELSYLVHELIDYKPDLVIALDGFNDFSVLLWNPKDRWKDFNGGEATEGQLREHYLQTQSNILDRLKNLHRIVFFRSLERVNVIKQKWASKQPTSESDSENEVSNTLVGEEVAASYVSNVSKMSMVSKAFSSKFLVVMQPTRDALTARANATISYTDFCESVSHTLAAMNANVLNTNDSSKLFAQEMYGDVIHLNKEGNHVLASIVAQKIIHNGLLLKQID